MSESEYLNAIIIAFRASIDGRYQYDQLKENYDIPDSFNEEKVEKFKQYFLEHLYPHPDKRAALNEAFQSLDEYIKRPEKLLRILIDSSRLVFKYGRHLPKILNAGIRALRSFQTATNFEEKLVKAAQNQQQIPPFTQADIEGFIRSLSPKDIEQFIENSQGLFETLHDRKLVKKILEIVQFLMDKMRQRPNIYSAAEVKGLEIGRDIIKIGDQLFEQLSATDQARIFKVIVQIEKDFLKNIFEGNK